MDHKRMLRCRKHFLPERAEDGRPAKRAPFCEAAAVALWAVGLRSVTTDVQVKTVGGVSVTLLNMWGWFKITSSNFFEEPRTSEKHHTSVFVLS